jgi:hypothetical protein
MMTIEPIKYGVQKPTRASPGMYWDAQGVLQKAQANEFRITYDPKDLTAPPRALIEGRSVNGLRNSTAAGAGVGVLPDFWAVYSSALGLTYTSMGPPVIEDGIKCFDFRVFGTVTTGGSLALFPDGTTYPQAGNVGEDWVFGAFMRRISGTWNGVLSQFHVLEEYDDGHNYLAGLGYWHPDPTTAPLREQFFECTRKLTHPLVTRVGSYFGWVLAVGATVDFTVRVGLPILERGTKAGSPIETSNGAVVREADVLPDAASMLYSNIAVTEPPYAVATTYAKGDLVLDPSTMNVYESLVAANLGNALSEATKWLPKGPTNRWAMFDDYNNTQTSAVNEVVTVLSPKAVAQGFYVGNVDGTEITVVVQDLLEGVVYTQTKSLVVSDSASSFFNWCFKRIRKKRFAVNIDLPVYANAIVTIRIRNDGGTARCGMCVVGVLSDIGLTEWGVAPEIKDYSTSLFNFDGTSKRTKRPWAKRLSVDVILKNESLDSVMELLASYCQVPVVWIGIERYDWACAFGTFSSLKTVVENYPESKMALQIEGFV